MQYMVLQRSEADAHAPLPGMTLLEPASGAVRLHIEPGQVVISDGPFEDGQTIGGFAVIDAASKEDALAQLRDWPLPEGAELEVRMSGCPGGCAAVQPSAPAHPQATRYVILLRSSDALEAEAAVPQTVLDTLDAHNAVEARAGVLVAADGLRSTHSGARVKAAGGKRAVLDGPFTEIKELIAGYWMIQVPSLEAAIAWAKRNPYPSGPAVDVEIRAVRARAAPAFTDDVRAAEQGMRAQQLESAMRAQLAGR